MDDALIRHYIENAVAFVPAARGARPLRIATTLVTCELAVALLNAMRHPAEPAASYAHINTHNPQSPLRYEPKSQRWTCEADRAQHPVSGINWAGAARIAAQLGARLPFAREWECFASNNAPEKTYPWGDAEPTLQLANFGEHFSGTTPVGQFPASDMGLYDLAGNLSEWCQDHPQADGKPMLLERVVKGGAWSKDAAWLRIGANRGKWERLGTTTIGLRPVWEAR